LNNTATVSFFLDQLLQSPHPQKSGSVMKGMMKMLKLDMSLMQTAFDDIWKYWLVSLVVFDYTILQVFECRGICGTS
jgi:hypothetical protein